MKLISFTQIENSDRLVNGKAIVEDLNGKRRELPASETDRYVMVYGFAVKYPTGKKVWFGRIVFFKDGGHSVQGGRDDNRGRRLQVVGFFEDVKPDYWANANGNG